MMRTRIDVESINQAEWLAAGLSWRFTASLVKAMYENVSTNYKERGQADSEGKFSMSRTGDKAKNWVSHMIS